MEAEWSVDAGADDPVIVVPWSDDRGNCGYLDLRGNPDLVEQIPETAQWPELRSALLLLNAEDSELWTSKCDAWELTEEEKSLDFGSVAFGIGCYIDILSAQSEQFASLDDQVALVKRLTRETALLRFDDARADFILRPAWIDEVAGFGTTAYVYGYGENPAEARRHWANVLAAVVRLILDETFKRYSIR